ncbi:MAG: hypothetical protein IJY24_07265 [Clostridia bacterium]|nr:hypothetical protein [Clostridia bacterium]
MGKKKNKPKVTYVDDGSTIADMSAVGGGRKGKDGLKLQSSFMDKTKTFFSAMKMMIGPMIIAITIIGATFLIGWFLLFLLG